MKDCMMDYTKQYSIGSGSAAWVSAVVSAITMKPPGREEDYATCTCNPI